MARPRLPEWRDVVRTARGQNAYARLLEEVASGPRAAGKWPEKQQAGERANASPALSDPRRSM